PVTFIDISYSRRSWGWLQDRSLAVVIALCTYQMRRFGALCLWFQRISRSSPYFREFIFLLFTFPCFKVSNFFFKIAYLFQQRKLRLLGRKCALLGGKDLSLQFENLVLNYGGISDTYKASSDFKRGLQ